MKEGWKEVILKDVAPYFTKKIEAKELNAENYISADNMLVDRGGITNSVYVPTSGKSTLYNQNDILVSNIRPYFKKIWYAKSNGGCSNDVIVFRTIGNIADSRFIYYYLSKDDFFDYMMAGSNGTKMPRGNKKSIPEYKIELPPLPTQRKIASILSGYDDLIENNLKRIKLLEEKAQLTYEEWFVIMRFPGFETAVFDEVSELPEGWKKMKLSDVAEINSSSIKKNFDGLIRYIDIASVSPNKIDYLTEYEINLAPGRAKRIVKHGDIIWSCVRPNRRSHTVIWKPEDNLIASTGFCVITPKTIPTSYLYQYLITESFVGYLTSLASGAAYPAVKSIDFSDADVIIPSNDLLIKFNQILGENFDIIWNLQTQNRFLKEARDILLPRLMSGMVDVEKLQIETLQTAE